MEVLIMYSKNKSICIDFPCSRLVSKFRSFYDKHARLITIFMLSCIISVSSVLIAILTTKYTSANNNSNRGESIQTSFGSVDIKDFISSYEELKLNITNDFESRLKGAELNKALNDVQNNEFFKFFDGSVEKINVGVSYFEIEEYITNNAYYY